MNTDKNKKFETVDELVAYVLAHPNNTDRFNMNERSSREWDNEADGAAWMALVDEQRKAQYAYRQAHRDTFSYYDPEYQKLEEEETKLGTLRPSEHTVYEVTLCESGEGYHHRDYFETSPALGAMIKSVWTMKPAYRGASYTKPWGAITLKSLLERLGKTDVSKQIEAKKAEIKAQDEKNGRNYYRRAISKQADELMALIAKAQANGVTVPAQLSEMAALAGQQEL